MDATRFQLHSRRFKNKQAFQALFAGVSDIQSGPRHQAALKSQIAGFLYCNEMNLKQQQICCTPRTSSVQLCFCWRDIMPICFCRIWIGGMILVRHALSGLHRPTLAVSILVIQCQLKLKFTRRRSPNHLPMPLTLSVAGVERWGWTLGDHALIPIPVILQRVQDVLRIRVNQVGPRLPQRVDNVVDEANLDDNKQQCQ